MPTMRYQNVDVGRYLLPQGQGLLSSFVFEGPLAEDRRVRRAEDLDAFHLNHFVLQVGTGLLHPALHLLAQFQVLLGLPHLLLV